MSRNCPDSESAAQSPRPGLARVVCLRHLDAGRKGSHTPDPNRRWHHGRGTRLSREHARQAAREPGRVARATARHASAQQDAVGTSPACSGWTDRRAGTERRTQGQGWRDLLGPLVSRGPSIHKHVYLYSIWFLQRAPAEGEAFKKNTHDSRERLGHQRKGTRGIGCFNEVSIQGSFSAQCRMTVLQRADWVLNVGSLSDCSRAIARVTLLWCPTSFHE